MKALLSAVLLLTVPLVAQAAPFTPDRFSLVTTRSYFDESGTTIACFECDDADPLNDVRFFGGAAVFATDLTFEFSLFQLGAGTFSVHSDVPFDPPGPASGITIEATLSLWDSSAPELVSVTNGILTGVISQDGVYCCDGTINTVGFRAASSFPRVFPDPTHSTVDVIIILANAPQNPEFTPAPTEVPEPLSLLLVGSGLAWGSLRRRRAGSRP